MSQQGNNRAVVTAGLSPGDKVVISGQSRLQKGTLIKPAEAKPQAIRRRPPSPRKWRRPRLPRLPRRCSRRPPSSPQHRRPRRPRPDMAVNVSAPFIRQPIATSLLMVGILFVRHGRLSETAGGAAAAGRLPDHPGISARCRAPVPRRWRPLSRQPLESQFSQIPGVSQMTSISTSGSTAITIQFDLDRNIDGAAKDVQAAINAAGGQLPKNLPSPPTYRKVNPADSPILLLAATSDTLPLTEVDDEVETKLAQQISQISGVGQVLVGGQQKPCDAHPARSRQAGLQGLSLEDVRTPALGYTVDSPKGTLERRRRAPTPSTPTTRSLEAEPWNDVIVAYRNGGALRVRDIGQAVTAPEDTRQAAWADGKRGVFLVIFKQPGANVIQTVDRSRRRCPD